MRLMVPTGHMEQPLRAERMPTGRMEQPLRAERMPTGRMEQPLRAEQHKSFLHTYKVGQTQSK